MILCNTSATVGSPDLLVIEPKFLRKSVRESARSLGGSHGSSLEQIELGPAVHLPLHQLQPVDLTFDLPVAPALRERRPYGPVVAAQALGEAAKLGRSAGGGW